MLPFNVLSTKPLDDPFSLLCFSVFIVEPLRQTTVLNRQAATRFIEHSLPDLTSGNLSYSFCSYFLLYISMFLS